MKNVKKRFPSITKKQLIKGITIVKEEELSKEVKKIARNLLAEKESCEINEFLFKKTKRPQGYLVKAEEELRKDVRKKLRKMNAEEIKELKNSIPWEKENKGSRTIEVSKGAQENFWIARVISDEIWYHEQGYTLKDRKKMDEFSKKPTGKTKH